MNAPSAPALDVVPVRTGSDVQRPFAPIAIAVIVAVALRLAVSWVASDAPAVADMEQYHARAVHLLQHRGFGPDALRGPGYPLLLAGAYATLGESYWSARVFNAVAGGVLVFLTAVLARALGSPWAWVAAMFVAVYPGLVLSSIYLMPDSFFAVWVVGCLASLHRRPLGWAALAGGLAGAAMLTRSLGILLVPTAAAVWVFAWARGDVSWRQVAARAALFVAVCALVIAPWLNFTAGVTGRPLLDSTSGFNALVGSNPRATGRLEMRDNEWLMETYVRGATSVADADARAFRAALAWAADHPGRWARLGITKVANLWGLEGREHSALYSRNYFGQRHESTVWVWGGALLASFPLLVVAALAGALGLGPGWTAPRVSVAAAILITTVLHVLSFGESRFHLPLVPLLAILASGGWPSSQRVSRPQAVAAIVALLFLGWGWTQQLPELRQRLDTLVGPNGSSSVIEY